MATLIGFFPVLHHGYISLLQKEDWETVYWLPEEILEKWERYENLKRDLRWETLEGIPNIIDKAGLVSKIEKLSLEKLDELQGKIVMPDEDVSRWFAETYLVDKDVTYEQVFLRADFSHVAKKDFVDPDAEITEDELHVSFMKQAEELKEKSPDWWRQIAAVAVVDGKVIASACNHGAPSDFRTALHGDPRSQFDAGESIEICSCIHAEASVVAQVAKQKDVSLDSADIYVTTFPCPVCAKLLSETGVKQVFYKEGYSKGEGKEVLQAAGIKLIKVA